MESVRTIWLMLFCVAVAASGTIDSQGPLLPPGLLQPNEWLPAPVDGYMSGPLLLPQEWANDPEEPLLEPPFLYPPPPPHMQSTSVPEPSAWVFMAIGIGMLAMGALPRRLMKRAAITKSSIPRASEPRDPSASS